MSLIHQLRPTAVFLLLLTLLFGGAYPLVATGFAKALFPGEAQGSLLHDHAGNPLGSALIGQNFTSPRYFWGRLSATAPVPYNAAASTGTNYGVNNPALANAAQDRIAALLAADPGNTHPVPVDLVTASGSGLDPHISPEAADYQIARVARARGMPVQTVEAFVQKATQGRQLGVLGEPRVNVLQLNLMLDGNS